MKKQLSLGPVRRWIDGDICFAANDFVTTAYVIDEARAGTSGWHGPKQIWVEYVSPPATNSADDGPA